MLVLDATTKSITVAMSAAAATTNPDFVTTWADNNGASFTEGSSDGALNGTSQVTMVAAPAASTRRIINGMFIENKDTAPVTLTITYNDNSTLRNIAKVTLAVGDTWTTNGTFDSTGALKQSGGGSGVSSFSGGTTGFTPSTATTGAVTLAGTLAVANGGTGVTTSTGSGNTVLSTSPTLVTPVLGTPTSVTLTNATGLPLSTGVTGTLGVANGGTGLTSLTANYIPYGAGTSAFSSSSSLKFDGSTLFVGAGTALGGTTNPISTSLGSANNYIQSYIFNSSNGVNASADFVAYPDNGTDTSGWADVGCTSSLFAQAAYSVTGPNEGYFFVSAPSGASKTGNMVLATDSTGTSNAIQFYTGGFSKSKSAYAAQIDGNGVLSIGGASTASNGLLQVLGVTSLQTVIEKTTVTATAATGTINFDLSTQADLYYTSNASGNFTLNFRGNSGTSLNTLMQTGQTITAVFRNTNGTTAYYNSAVTVDGTSVTPKWQGGTAPSSGNASSTDVYTYAITKTGSAAFTIFASQVKFA